MAALVTGPVIRAARAIGVDPCDYVTNRAAGKRWCSNCAAWHAGETFGAGQKSCKWSQRLKHKFKRKGRA